MEILKQLIIDENNVAFHPQYGTSFQLNPIGKQIVELLLHNNQLDEIIEQVALTYGVKKEDVYIDVYDFIAKLKVYGLYL